MPIDYANYPPDWKDIRARIMARARYRCECTGECGLHPGRRCAEYHGERAMWAKGRIVLTIAHLDHDVTHNDDDNLKAMCQRCHLRLDREQHAESAGRTRDRKRGQRRMEFLDD